MDTDTHERDELASLVGFEARLGADVPDGWPMGTKGWRVTLTFGRTVDEWDYFTGPAIMDYPTVEDVLGSLFLDARLGEDEFETFCSELGEDEDSRKTYATWEACADTYKRLRFMFGDRFEEFANVEWDV